MKRERLTGIRDEGLRLIQAARRARRYARAPYSGYTVGAALETIDGLVVTGCNIENASYGLTICAERVALFTAIAAGHRRFRRLAIASHAGVSTPPCGACRQVLWEFAPELEIVLVGGRAPVRSITLRELLPLAFDGGNLTAAQGRSRAGRRARRPPAPSAH